MTPVEPSHCSFHLQRLVGHRDPVKPPGQVHRQPCPQRPHQLARSGSQWHSSLTAMSSSTSTAGSPCCRTAPRIGSHSSRPHWGKWLPSSVTGGVVTQLRGGHHH